jgi:transcriptional regulator of met regulon
MPHPRRTSRKTEPLRPTLSLNSISKCNTASHALFTPESSRLEEFKREKTDSLPKESKEMLLVK